MVSIITARLLKIFALQIVQYLPFNSFVVSSAYKERKPLALRSALFHSSEKANNVPIPVKEYEIHGQVFSEIKLWEGKVKVQLFTGDFHNGASKRAFTRPVSIYFKTFRLAGTPN